MDQAALVSAGRKLIELMDRSGPRVRAAMWVRDPDDDTWKLWIVPDAVSGGKPEFYRRVAELISGNRLALSGLDVSDTEMVSEKHPAILALSRLFGLTGNKTLMTLSKQLLDGFYLTEGIILRMDLPPQPRSAA